MNGREKRIHKDHTNERKQSQQREQDRRDSERIQELIQQTRSNLEAKLNEPSARR